jgi:hypothetical protein
MFKRLWYQNNVKMENEITLRAIVVCGYLKWNEMAAS